MASLRTFSFVALLSATLVAGCGDSARKDYEHQLEVCTAGELNGVLDAAAEGCGTALNIARENNYLPDDISDLSYRLARIERQRGRFAEAETLLWDSLKFESQISDSAGVASRLVELSLCMAGQDRWEEGVRLLDRAEPYLRSLEGDEREAAVNALRGYAIQLGKLGDAEAVDRLTALSRELDAA